MSDNRLESGNGSFDSPALQGAEEVRVVPDPVDNWECVATFRGFPSSVTGSLK